MAEAVVAIVRIVILVASQSKLFLNLLHYGEFINDCRSWGEGPAGLAALQVRASAALVV